ncbi:MAG: ankyrin repeat domain-containing protein [Burkholderiaceae bacterium]
MPSTHRTNPIAISIVGALLVALAASPTRTSAAAAGDYDEFFHDVEIDYAGGAADLISKGFDPNTRNAKDQPALTVALLGKSLKVAKVLWEAPGIQIDARNKADETPLMMAALKGEADAAAALVARGASVRKDGWSPLHYATTGGNAAIVKLLVAHGAPVDARSPNATTPLMMAAMYGSEGAVDALLAGGADRSLKNDEGLDAAAFAAKAGRDKLALRLKAENAAR